jgi:hypothetical protein
MSKNQTFFPSPNIFFLQEERRSRQEPIRLRSLMNLPSEYKYNTRCVLLRSWSLWLNCHSYLFGTFPAVPWTVWRRKSSCSPGSGRSTGPPGTTTGTVSSSLNCGCIGLLMICQDSRLRSGTPKRVLTTQVFRWQCSSTRESCAPRTSTSDSEKPSGLDTSNLVKSYFLEKNWKKIAKKNVLVLRRPEDETMFLFEGLFVNPDVPLRPYLFETDVSKYVWQ